MLGMSRAELTDFSLVLLPRFFLHKTCIIRFDLQTNARNDQAVRDALDSMAHSIIAQHRVAKADQSGYAARQFYLHYSTAMHQGLFGTCVACQ